LKEIEVWENELYYVVLYSPPPGVIMCGGVAEIFLSKKDLKVVKRQIHE